MKIYDMGATILISVVLTCILAGLTSTYIWGPDNKVEEAAEEIVQMETGIKLDLTPSSMERKDPIEMIDQTVPDKQPSSCYQAPLEDPALVWTIQQS